MNKKQMPETSISAFQSLDPKELNETYRMILEALGELGEGTFEDIAAKLRIDKSRVWKRLSELNKMNLIYRTKNKRVLKSGRRGFTWMLTSVSLPKVEVPESLPKMRIETKNAIWSMASLF